jgi:thioredoxin-like negative regulator of GroEL
MQQDPQERAGARLGVYADRMQKAGRIDEAFRALKEFADLAKNQDDIRLMLVEQLTATSRMPEALEQLQALHERYDAAGRIAEAQGVAERMKAIDRTVTPRRAAPRSPKRTGGGLVFIELGAPLSLSA